MPDLRGQRSHLSTDSSSRRVPASVRAGLSVARVATTADAGLPLKSGPPAFSRGGFEFPRSGLPTSLAERDTSLFEGPFNLSATCG